MFGRCDYSTMDWWCEKPEGHDGPHEMILFSVTDHSATAGAVQKITVLHDSDGDHPHGGD